MGLTVDELVNILTARRKTDLGDGRTIRANSWVHARTEAEYCVLETLD